MLEVISHTCAWKSACGHIPDRAPIGSAEGFSLAEKAISSASKSGR